jgi:tyrosyl-tRNA synthetase
MKMLTLIETEEIDKIVAKHLLEPEKREWQKLLAYKIIEIIHGNEEADLALKISDFMFGWLDRLAVLKSLDNDKINTFQKAMWGFNYSWENLFEIIVKSWLANSNTEARQAVQSWAISINEEKILDFNFDFSKSFINDKVLLISKGKKNFRIIRK